MKHICDVLVVGAGAAGLMTALTAGRRGRRVQVIDHANKVGKKILMSGGGRCNFTNTGTSAANFISANPHFCKSALARFTPNDILAMIEAHRIGWHEKELGQLFCDISSKLIVKMLLDECQLAGAQIRTDCSITELSTGSDGFEVTTTAGRFHCQSLVVATGGLSIPSLGASGLGYDIARRFGHELLPTRAGLVPLVLSGKHQERLQGLAGVALPVEARCHGTRFRNALLFTHRGISGPAILQISSYWQPGDRLILDLLPGYDAAQWLREQKRDHANTELRNALGEVLPRRFAQRLCEVWLPNKPMRQLDDAELRSAADLLTNWPLTASGSEGYRTAEVTLGGVSTELVSSTTMESRRVRGLYFVGEVLDVSGWLGGYNFQWAWASGHAAGMAA